MSTNTKISFCVAIKTGKDDPIHKWRIKNLNSHLDAFRRFEDKNFDLVYALWPSDDIVLPSDMPHKVVEMNGYFNQNQGFNQMAEAADGMYIFFADLDLLFPSNSCAIIRKYVKPKQVYFPVWYSHGGYGEKKNETLWERRPHAYSQSGWIREEHIQIGGHCEKQSDSWGGDIDIFNKAKKHGFKVIRENWPGDFKKGLVHQYHPHYARNFYYQRDDKTKYTPLKHETKKRWDR